MARRWGDLHFGFLRLRWTSRDCAEKTELLVQSVTTRTEENTWDSLAVASGVESHNLVQDGLGVVRQVEGPRLCFGAALWLLAMARHEKFDPGCSNDSPG
jgi:hypothetical protein